MSARRTIWEVARREIVERSRTRTWRISFAILLALVVGGSVAAARIGASTPSDDFGVAGARPAGLEPALRLQAAAADRRARLHPLADRAAAEAALRDGSVDVAIVDGRLLVERDPDGAPVHVAQGALTAVSTVARLQQLGLTQAQAVAALSQRPRPVAVLDPGARDYDRDRDVLAVGILLLFTALIGYGTTVASSVTEEKSSRVVELLLTSVSPRRLMAGKVLGAGTLGLAQLATVGAAALIAGAAAGGEGLPSAAPGVVALVVAWFVLGFAFYSVGYAAIGALVSRQEDLESAYGPITAVMVASFFLAMASLEDPDRTWVQIVGYLPPFAPLVVPARVVLGSMGALGLTAAIALQLAATFLLIMLGARVYERALLRIGAPVRLRSVLRLGRAAR